MNPREQVFAWMRDRAVGCHFAMLLGKEREQYRKRWLDVEFDRGADAATFTRSAMPKALDNKDIEAALYVFPELSGPDDCAMLIKDLCADSLWTYSVVPKLAEAAPEGAIPISIVLEMPWLEGQPCNVAEVIGLGDFDPMPPTRRAPFMALGFRNGGRTRPDSEGRPEINLCDIPMDISDKSFSRAMKTSSRLRTAALGEYPAGAAKAQLTFMLPQYAARDLEGT